MEDVAWHAVHDHLFGSVGDDHHLLLWDIRKDSEKPLHTVEAHQAEVIALELSELFLVENLTRKKNSFNTFQYQKFILSFTDIIF